MTRYARETSVSVARSRAEIEDVITRYGASAFGSMMGDGHAAIVFEANGRRVMFKLMLPAKEEFRSTKVRNRTVKRTDVQVVAAWEQACRQRWRALALVVKAKLEAVESKITTFEDEFLAHIVLPNGGTVGDVMRPQLHDAYNNGKMPALLSAPGAT